MKLGVAQMDEGGFACRLSSPSHHQSGQAGM